MPKVARLVPSDAEIVNAHEWLALRPGRIAAGRLGVPLVWTRNDESAWERVAVPELTIHGDPRLTRRAFRATYAWPDLVDARQAAAIVVLSQGQAEMVRRSYRKDALVVPAGPPPQFFDSPDRQVARARLGIPNGVFLVLASGILVEHRRFETLVDAMSLLSDDPSIHALILGSDHVDRGYADRLAARIAEHRLNDRVALPRRSVSDREIKDAYAAADVFVILSQRYAWGLAPLEAIASGTPVILTPGAGVYGILAGRPGVQAAADDAAAVAVAVRTWRSGRGRNGLEATRTWLRREFGMERYVERMEQVYRSLVPGPASSTHAPHPP
jgi:glycosyltransferase involved in cell wall biosynthesis